MKKNRGFTLIELLIVVLILAILLALVLVNYRHLVEDNRARNAVKILRMLGAARRMQLIDNGNPIECWGLQNSFFDDSKIICPDDIGDIDTVGELHGCGYGDLRGVDWDKMRPFWRFCLCGNSGSPCCASFSAPEPNTIAMAWRVDTTEDPAPKYSRQWRYFYTQDGRCIEYTGNSEGEIPPCVE